MADSIKLNTATMVGSAISLVAALLWTDGIRAVSDVLKPRAASLAAAFLIVFATIFTILAGYLIYEINRRVEDKYYGNIRQVNPAMAPAPRF